MTGPETSPFGGGTFYLSVRFPERYPFEPPHITFKTRIYHPNIDSEGRICLDLLKLPPQGAWKPHINLSSVLNSLLLLMAEPNPNDPLEPQIAEEYKTNRALFEQRAKQQTLKYAIETEGNYKMGEISAEVKSELPSQENVVKRKIEEMEQNNEVESPVKTAISTKPVVKPQNAGKKNPFAVLGKKPRH